MSFRNPKYLKNYTWNEDRLSTPIEIPQANQAQHKVSYRFDVNESQTEPPLDLYNAVFEFTVSLRLRDGGSYTNNTLIC